MNMKGFENVQNIDDIVNGINDASSNKKEKCQFLLDQIISNLPKEYRDLIEAAHKYKRVPKEYLLSSILFAASTAAGTVFYTHELGYKNYGNLYFVLVGSRGDTKSEGIKTGIRPIIKIDTNLSNQFDEEFQNSNKDDRDDVIKKQNLLQNSSIEAITEAHKNNPSGIGMFHDECKNLFEKMGNPNSRDGSEYRTFFLEGYTNNYIDIARKTTRSFRINQSYFTFIGGIQHEFIPKMFANGNLESGLMDRVLFVNKLSDNRSICLMNMPIEIEENYKNSFQNILAYKTQSEKPEEKTKSFQLKYNPEALKKLETYITEKILQQYESASPFKEYLSKMMISIHKLCIVLHLISNSTEGNLRSTISIETVQLAINLNEFYFINYKILLENKSSKDSDKGELNRIIQMAQKNGAKQKDVVAVTGASKSTISRQWNKQGNIAET